MRRRYLSVLLCCLAHTGPVSAIDAQTVEILDASRPADIWVITIHGFKDNAQFTIACHIDYENCCMPPVGRRFRMREIQKRIYRGENVGLYDGSGNLFGIYVLCGSSAASCDL